MGIKATCVTLATVPLFVLALFNLINLFLAILSGTQDLLLVMHPGINPGGLRGSYGATGINSGSAASKTNALATVL